MDTSALRRLALGTAIALWRERIRELAHGEKLTQDELQGLADLTRGSVSRFERGVNTPGQEELRRIARVLKTDVPALLDAADLLYELLLRALGPLRLIEGHEGKAPPPGSEIADREIPVELPEDQRRRWERLLAAEGELARERHELEFLRGVHAGRLAAALGPPAS